MKFVLKKKKKILKPKQIYILYTEKPQKEKKNLKRKEMNKGTCTAKKKIILRNLRLNLRKCTAALVLVEDTEVTNKEKGKS